MNGLTRIRQQKAAWTRRVLSAFVVGWFAMVLQPCAMAMGVSEHPDCPHCPPAETPPCEVLAVPDCVIDDTINAEARSLQLKLKDSPNNLLVAVATTVAEPERLTQRTLSWPRDTVLLNPSGPPRHVLFCVYLK